MALGGGGLAQGGTGLVWARLAAPRMGLVGLAEGLDGLGGPTVGWAPRPMGLEEALHRAQASTLSCSTSTHFRAMLEFLHNLNHFLLAATTIGASLDKRSPKDKFSHNPQSLVAVQTLLTAISKIVRVFKKLRAHISLLQTISGKLNTG